MKKETYIIQGMRCASCVATIERALGKTAGVRSASANFASESANITLMRGDLMLISEVIKISRRTIRIIKQNLFWAFFYNIAFIPVAAGVLYPFWKILLNPIFAAAAMAFSSLSVVLNSLRLRS